MRANLHDLTASLKAAVTNSLRLASTVSTKKGNLAKIALAP